MAEIIEFIIGADLFPNETNEDLFVSCLPEDLIGTELASRLYSADFRIFNLEGVLTNQKSPIAKSGPIISAPENTIHGVKSLNPDLLVLSNNHILDEGQVGVERTLSVLRDNNIPYIGIGNTEIERRKSFIFEKYGIKIGVYNCCEHEFSISKEGEWGANPYDPLFVFDDVRELKSNCDFAIVLYHGGKEYFRYPSPQLQRVFRKFAETGANAVIAQHTHCIGSFEKYDGSLLVYGQGNFLFDTEESEYENTSLLVSLKFHSDGNMLYEYVPICKSKNTTRIATENEKKEILDSFNTRSANLSNKNFLEAEYQKNAIEYLRGYLLTMHIGTKLDSILLRLFLKFPVKLRQKIFKKSTSKLLAVKNYFDCESHRDLILEGMKSILDL